MPNAIAEEMTDLSSVIDETTDDFMSMEEPITGLENSEEKKEEIPEEKKEEIPEKKKEDATEDKDELFLPPELFDDDDDDDKDEEDKDKEEEDKDEEDKDEEEDKEEDDPKKDSVVSLRKRVEAQQKIIDDYKKGASTEGTSKEIQERLKALEEENKRLDTDLSRTSLAKSPSFQKKWNPKIKSLVDTATETTKAFNGDDKIIGAALRLGIKERYAFLNKHVPEAVSILMPNLAELDRTLQAREQELTDFKKTSLQLDLKTTASQEQQTKEFKAQLKNKTMAEITKKGHFVFKKIDGNDAWNKKVDGFQENVTELFQTDDIAKQAEALALSVAAPIYLDLWKEERATRLSLEKRLGIKKSSSPKIGGKSSKKSSRNPGGISVSDAVDDISSRIFG